MIYDFRFQPHGPSFLNSFSIFNFQFSIIMLDQIWENIQRVKEESPLVHNITNAVVMNNTANALLAAGASPIMAHALEEIDEMVALCRATVINIGTLDRFTVESMKAAIRRAN